MQYCLLQLFGSYLLLNQADASNCLPSHIFKKDNHRDDYLGVAIRLLPGSHMAIYVSPRAAAANAGAYRRPTGVTEQFVPRRLLPD